jgi:tetratricopeptide (TPR) repeat protein
MPAILDGLNLTEVVLLVLGVALFLVVLIGLGGAMMKGRPFIKLLPFSFVSLAMIAYPGIQTLKISATEVDIQTTSAALEKDPTNQAARVKLSSDLSSLAERQFSAPQILTDIARGQLILDDKQAAVANLQKALQKNPTLPDAVALQKRIQTEDQLPALTQQVVQHPDDAAAKAALQQSVTDITKTGVANPVTLTTVAKAQAALGNNDQAVVSVNRALQINPKLAEAVRLKSQIQAPAR